MPYEIAAHCIVPNPYRLATADDRRPAPTSPLYLAPQFALNQHAMVKVYGS